MKKNQLQGSESLLLVRKQLCSCYSTAANVMNCFGLDKVVQIYLPACSEEQYQALIKHIQNDVICVIPLKRGTRMFIYCDYLADLNDEQGLFVYQMALDAVFAKPDGRMTMPYGVRIYEKANYDEPL